MGRYALNVKAGVKYMLALLLSGAVALGGFSLVVCAAGLPGEEDTPAQENPESHDPGAEMLAHLMYKADPHAPVMSQSELQRAVDDAVRYGLPSVQLTGNVYLNDSVKIWGLKKPLVLDGGGYTMMFADPLSENSRHIVISQPDGFNISVALRNLRLEGGGAALGGGVSVGSGVDIRIEYCVITGNSAREGGGVYNYNNEIYIYNSVIAGNSAEVGGGLYSYHGNIFVDGPHTELSGNTATLPDGGGGGIYGHSNNIVLSGGRFIENSTAGFGGAVYLHRGGIISAVTSTFSGNTAVDGGALAIGADAEYLYLSGCFIVSNKAVGRKDGRGGYGGGAYRQGGGTLQVESSLIMHNEALFGGGLFTGSGSEDRLYVSGSVLSGNTALHDGGGIYASERITSAYPRPAYIASTLIDANIAGRNGGGIYTTGHASLVLGGVRFSGNTARSCIGWDTSSPDELYSELAAIYGNNILSAVPSRPDAESGLDRFHNVYNNYDVNFPPSVTVIYRPWGGRWGATDDMQNHVQSLFVGEEPTPPGEPYRFGYIFGGWRVATIGYQGVGSIWSFGERALRSVALDAVWLTGETSLNLILKPMGGIWADGSSRNLSVSVEKNGFAYQPYALSRPGYRFLGWYNQSNNKKWDFAVDIVTQDNTVLVARWAYTD